MQQLRQTTSKYKIYQVVKFCSNFEKQWMNFVGPEAERIDNEKFRSEFQHLSNLYFELKNHTTDLDYFIDSISEKMRELESKYPLKYFDTFIWSEPKLINLEGKIVGKS